MVLSDRFNNWIKTLEPAKLDAFIDEQKGKESLKDALINFLLINAITYAIVALIGAIFLIIFATLFAFLLSPVLALLKISAAAGIAGIGVLLLLFVLVLIASYIASILIGFLFNGILWILAKLVGGQASYTRQTHVGSYLNGGIGLLYILLMLVGLIPCIGFFISICFYIYILYLNYRLMKKVHQLSTARAAAVVLIPVLLFIALYLVLFFLQFLGALTRAFYYPAYPASQLF